MIRQLFAKRTAAEQRLADYEEAQLFLLDAQNKAEYWRAVADAMTKRIARLKPELEVQA
jgi:hypothetical protein